MNKLAPHVLLIAVGFASLGFLTSSNSFLWATCILALPALFWLIGGKAANRALLWVVGMSWIQIFGDVLAADAAGETIADDVVGPYREMAMLFSLSAIMALVFGMRCGVLLGGQKFRVGPILARQADPSHLSIEIALNFNRLLVCYFASVGLMQVFGTVASVVPALAQPIVALGLLKYVCLYVVAITVIDSQRGYLWLILIAIMEIATGMISYFSSYKEAIFVILIAVASARRSISLRTWGLAAAVVVVICWVSVGWTLIKKDYRHKMGDMDAGQQISYIVNEYLYESWDYQRGLRELFERIGYTTYYSKVLALEDSGLLARDFHFYAGAIQHVLTPRILFPDKAQLDDSAISRALLGMTIDDQTSIGVGYVAQAHVDFGFPGMLVPVAMIGLMMGLAAQYFMTRPVPLQVGEAFAVAALFNCFRFEANIDKQLGGFTIGVLVLALVLKYGYPMIARFLVGHEFDLKRSKAKVRY